MKGVVVVMWYGGPGWGGWLVMGVIAIVFWALLVVAGLAVWRADRRSPREPDATRRTPEQLLDERFARGEITADEYRHRRELLRSPR